MSVTKSQILTEMQNRDFEASTVQSITETLQSFPEELSAEHVKQITEIFEELEATQAISERMYAEMADALRKASDQITDAADEYLHDVAQTTYDNVKLAQDLNQ